MVSSYMNIGRGMNIGRSRALATALAMVPAVVGCDRHIGFDGVWEMRGMLVVEKRWDTTQRRFRIDTVSMDATGMNDPWYLLLDRSGRLVGASRDDQDLLSGESGEAPFVVRKDGIVRLVSGNGRRTEPDSSCGVRNRLSCGWFEFTIERVGDRRDTLPADTVYLKRARNVRYWYDARGRFGDGLSWDDLARLRARVDSLSTLNVDIELVAHVQGIIVLLGELAMLHDESRIWYPYPTILPYGSGIFVAIRDLRTRLGTAAASSIVETSRAQQLQLRLDALEKRALALWEGEMALRRNLVARYRHPFKALEVFHGKP